jgi:hypothetical protein
MSIVNIIKRIVASLIGKKVKALAPIDSRTKEVDLSEPQSQYSYDLCDFTGEDVYEMFGKRTPYSFLFIIAKCWRNAYEDLYVAGLDPSQGFLVIVETTKSRNEVERMALVASDSSNTDAESCIKALLLEEPSTKIFCNADSRLELIPNEIRELLPKGGFIRYLLVNNKTIIVDSLSTVKTFGIQCNYGDIDIYISPNLSKVDTDKVLETTGRIYYLMHSEMTGALPEGAAIRIQHGRNLHWSKAVDQPYNQGIYVCSVNKEDRDKELPSAKVFASMSGKPTHAISLSTALKQYYQCNLKTREFITRIPKYRRDELLSEMHELARSSIGLETAGGAEEKIVIVIFNKDFIADLECVAEAVIRSSTLEGLRSNTSIAEDILKDLKDWTSECLQLADWIENSSGKDYLIILASTDSTIAAFKPLARLAGQQLLSQLTQDSVNEDNKEELAIRAGYASLLKNHDNWIDMEAFDKTLVEASEEFGLGSLPISTPMQLTSQLALFKCEAQIIINDSVTGQEWARMASDHSLGQFSLPLSRDLLEELILYHDSPSQSYESFCNAFASHAIRIKQEIKNVLDRPWFEDDDGLDVIIDTYDLYLPTSEIKTLCNYLEIPERDFYKSLIVCEGFEIDGICCLEEDALVRDFNSLKSGDITEEEFVVELSDTPVEFTVSCYMFFHLTRDIDQLADALYDLGEFLVEKDKIAIMLESILKQL